MGGKPEGAGLHSDLETGVIRRLGGSRSNRAQNPLTLVLVGLVSLSCLALTACGLGGLSSRGEVLLSARMSDPALRDTAATLPRLGYSERIQADYWLQRYHQDRTSGTAADLYVAEWNREVFTLLRESTAPASSASQVSIQRLWQRSLSAHRSPAWLSRLPYGPSLGFVPTAGYTWGLFVRKDQLVHTGDRLPSSLEDLEQVFADIAAKGQTPVALGTAFGWPGAAWFTMLDLRMNGPEVVWERYEGKRPWNDESARGVFRRLALWRDRHWFGSSAATGTQDDMIAAVSTGSAWCTLLGAYAVDRFPQKPDIGFISVPAGTSPGNKGELVSLTGFFIPPDSSNIEASLALADSYILGGSRGHVRDSYRVPIAAVLSPVKGRDPIPSSARPETLSGLRQAQAAVLARADLVVPGFDRAMPTQVVQDSIRLWADFFVPGGPDGDSFADRLQRVVGRNLP